MRDSIGRHAAFVDVQERTGPPEHLLEVVALLREAEQEALRCVNLTPSETRLSPFARQALGGDFSNRYFFNEALAPDFWEFRASEAVGRLEQELALDSLQRLSGASVVNVRPISGMSAMQIAMAARFRETGDRAVSIDPAYGGHYATSSMAARLGFTPVTVGATRGVVDLDELRDAVRSPGTRLVYLDMQNALIEPDYRGIVEAVREVRPGVEVHADVSHLMGLILGGAATNPLAAGVDSMGGSMHKTFPGPHKGALFTSSTRVAQQMRDAQMSFISSHHFASTLALGLAAVEFESFGQRYAEQVVRNSRALAAALAARGFDVVAHSSDLTDTHQVWVRPDDDAEAYRISDALARVGIRVNIQSVMPGMTGLTWRLGVNEMTFEGAQPASLELVADAFGQARTGPAPHVSASDLRATFGSPHWFDLSARGGERC